MSEIKGTSGEAGKFANRLIHEKSPYLLQHAHNPVQWFPWGEEAFKEARERKIPIFLSIGYSSCHWCHVMENESFADEEVAALLNRDFVPVKVDREERPDLDQFYMTAAQAMTGRGGWPLTVILTPDGKPFYAGTYYPKHSCRGMPGLMDVLEGIKDIWHRRRHEAINAGEELFEALQRKEPSGEEANRELPAKEVLADAYQYLESNFDPTYGGFGPAPKFPTPHQLVFLLRYNHNDLQKNRSKEMVWHTLQNMARGGIFDQLGYGFHRYSTDSRWLVPHFEKMLFDQATTSWAYLEAFQASGERDFARVAEKVFSYVLENLTSPEGAFYSAEDADMEGEEGAYYVWSKSDIYELLGESRGDLASTFWGLENGGNFTEDRSVLYQASEVDELAKARGEEPQDTAEKLEECRQILLQARQSRERPFLDDKIIVAWNGMMIAALSRGAFILDEPVYARAAASAGEFIWQNMRQEGRLLRRYRQGEAAISAFLEDYACLAWGYLELYWVTCCGDYLQYAYLLCREMVDLFFDVEQEGKLRFQGKDAEDIIAPVAEAIDSAHPSGVSVAANVLIMLGRAVRDQEILEKGEQVLRAYRNEMERAPHGHMYLLVALQMAYEVPQELVISGRYEDESFREMINQVRRLYRPHLTLLIYPLTEDQGVKTKKYPDEVPGSHDQKGSECEVNPEKVADIAPFVKEMLPPPEKQVAAFYCRGFQCQAPVYSPEDLKKIL